jgi:hypothetical protein
LRHSNQVFRRYSRSERSRRRNTSKTDGTSDACPASSTFGTQPIARISGVLLYRYFFFEWLFRDMIMRAWLGLRFE